MIDLHTHSSASDGSLTPEALALAGHAAGLTTMALTDHDSARGVEAFLAAARGVGLQGVPGIELSAEVPAGQLHLVGLGFDFTDAALKTLLEPLLEGRADRNARMLQAFNDHGIPLTMEEVSRYAGTEVVSRVHFAQALIDRGLATDRADAFARYLGKGAPCYRERVRYTPEACIAMIRNAGGVVMMAHPFSLTTDPGALEASIATYRAAGLTGMECYYSAYDPEQQLTLLRIALRQGLVPSAGSDFHGAPKPEIVLGHLPVPPEAEARLLHLLRSTWWGRQNPTFFC